MIVKAFKYKKSEGARRLSGYLAQDAHKRTEPGESRNLYVANALDGMRVMQCLQRASRARIAFWHIIISPMTQLDKKDLNRVLNLIITELNAADHPLMVWSHEKLRARRGGGPTHFHCVLGHVSPTTGLALDMRNHAPRLQKIAAIAAFDLEGQTSVSQYNDSIITHLVRDRRPDVASWLTDLRTESPAPQPRMTDAMRRSASARGLDLASFYAELQRLWNSDASEQAFERLFSNARVMVRRGDRSRDSVLLYHGDHLIGVLHRVLRQQRALVYTEATARFSGLFGKRINADDSPGTTPTSSIGKRRQEMTDDLELVLRRMRTETLRLTYNPPKAKVGSEDYGKTIARRLEKLARGEVIFDRALDLLWSDDTWLSAPIERLIIHAGRSLKVGKPFPLAKPSPPGHQTLSRQPVKESSDVLNEDEVMPGVRI